MKLNILSDLHLSRGTLTLPENDADVAILAGDIARPREGVAWASGFAKPVLYVPGNHEFYGGSIVGSVDALRQQCAGTNVHVLDNDEVIIKGVRFLGTTLWTDFMLFGEGEEQAAAIREAQRFMYDFSRIHIGDTPETLFTPADSAALFNIHAGWLERKLCRTVRRVNGGSHPSCAIAQEHPSQICQFAPERMLRLRCRAPDRWPPRATMDTRTYP